ncbi:MAG TPA: hypothetical protein VLH79_02830 [Chthonomonadales bacterium]|nr:hypothetical protein [Chthonomonadales bacterium]
MTLVEFLVAGIVALTVGAGLIILVQGTYAAHATIIGQNAATANARAAVDSLADRLRGAQLDPATGAALTTASAGEVAFWDFHSQYDDTQARTLVRVRYFVAGGVLRRTVNNLPASGEAIASGVEALAFVYYRHVPGSGWATTTNAADVGAVKITATVANNGYRRTITATVQVRQKRPAH